jgi:hypothetical protein
MTIYRSQDITAQEAYVSNVRIQEMLAERTGDPVKIAHARKRYDSAVAGLHMMLDEYNAYVERRTRPQR